MDRARYLNGQAALLRGVAGTFDVPSIRNRLLALANECQILARLVGESFTEGEAPRRRAAARNGHTQVKRRPRPR